MKSSRVIKKINHGQCLQMTDDKPAFIASMTYRAVVKRMMKGSTAPAVASKWLSRNRTEGLVK
jgi:hypothetical protein